MMHASTMYFSTELHTLLKRSELNCKYLVPKKCKPNAHVNTVNTWACVWRYS